MQMMTNQSNDTKILQNEISGVSSNMTKKLENTEKKMTDMITLSNINLRSLIQETARDFQTEIETVNKKLVETEKKNEDLIRKAIEVERKFESRLEKVEKTVENNSQQPAVSEPGPAASSSMTPAASSSMINQVASIPTLTFS